MRSSSVVAGLVGALALSLTACGPSGQRNDEGRCVNDKNIVVDESNCRSGGAGHWYYGGSGGRNLGSQAYGGSLTKPLSSTSKSSSGSGSADRGGLGSHGGSGGS